MQLIPVLDILNGVVVRGVAGQRDQYRPIESCLTGSVQALDVARAIRSTYHFHQFYVADLDAIMYGKSNERLYRELIAAGFRLWVDAGVSGASQARELLTTGIIHVIVGLESCPSPDALREIMDGVSTSQIVFSLDLIGGVPLASPAWGDDPAAIAAEVIRSGVTQLIVLDLAGVGTGAGVPTIPLCQRLRETHGPAISIITGGGVRGVEDIASLKSEGLDGVLLASILHRPGVRLGTE